MSEIRDVAVLQVGDQITVHGWGFRIEATVYEQLGTHVRASKRNREAGPSTPNMIIVSTAAIANHLLIVETGWAERH